MDLYDLCTQTREGLRVELAPLATDEADRVYELCQDADIQRWTTVPSPYKRKDARQFVGEYTVAAWQEIESGVFSAAKAGPELVWGVGVAGDTPLAGLWGCVGLKRLGAARYEIGYWLGAGARGHGIMRAAVVKVLEAAKEAPLAACEVWWHALVGNVPSARVAKAAGFGFMGVTTIPMHGDAPVWAGVLRYGLAV